MSSTTATTTTTPTVPVTTTTPSPAPTSLKALAGNLLEHGQIITDVQGLVNKLESRISEVEGWINHFLGE